MDRIDRSEFEEDLKLDPSQLDVEAVRLSETFFKWAERAVEARSDVDRLKLVHEVTEARLQAEVRKSPEKFGLDADSRITEAAINAAVKQHDRFVNTFDDYLEAREVSGLIDKAVNALEMKKRMIEVLITLHGQQYFAGPGTPRNLVEAWQKHQEKVGVSVRARQAAKARKRGEGATT